MTCHSCKGLGCSTRGLPEKARNHGHMTDLFSIERGEIRVRAVATDHGSARVHTCPNCMRGLPCQGVDPSSLSSLVGQIATRKPSEAEWKGREFGGWDANGSPASSYPGSETM